MPFFMLNIFYTPLAFYLVQWFIFCNIFSLHEEIEPSVSQVIRNANFDSALSFSIQPGGLINLTHTSCNDFPFLSVFPDLIPLCTIGWLAVLSVIKNQEL